MRIKNKGYTYKGYHLGQKVMHKGKECIIIGFDMSRGDEVFIAITSSLSKTVKLIESIYADVILEWCENRVDWEWVSPSEIGVIIADLKELDGLENGMGLVIDVVDDLFVVRYKETSDLIRNLKIAECHTPILKAMGFKFEYKRTKEEILKELKGLSRGMKDINQLIDENKVEIGRRMKITINDKPYNIVNKGNQNVDVEVIKGILKGIDFALSFHDIDRDERYMVELINSALPKWYVVVQSVEDEVPIWTF